MSEPTPSILFMDDEPNSDIVSHAVERLRASGFCVDVIETLGEAVVACYHRYYQVFILDIDMSHQVVDEDGDGVQVLKGLMALHNQTRVILFSGAGTVDHWFQAANAHCHAYIHKLDQDPDTGAESIERLLSAVRGAIHTWTDPGTLTPGVPPARLLLVGDDVGLNASARQAVEDALGADWVVDEQPLSPDLELDPSTYGGMLILQPQFKMRSRVREALTRLLALTPTPQCIVGCEGREEFRPSILDLANRHPFRLIDLLHPSWEKQLRDALQSACEWYGQTEIQNADLAALRRYQVLLPEDVDQDLQDEIDTLEFDSEREDDSSIHKDNGQREPIF
ncbi:hypothetical protein CKO25_12675 [Thiocapsa imhoffii]|uniref:Response regulatory domain-containing protein n=1 Tax=Thiocapsa imhoffii TaxID=382777 RepID=A0A9X1B948_9GAMM|nr:response regulator [Thiocapsa imhoffii]MBK1645482.1 hypothetical protein [Thiocapsa imhoffii]